LLFLIFMSACVPDLKGYEVHYLLPLEALAHLFPRLDNGLPVTQDKLPDSVAMVDLGHDSFQGLHRISILGVRLCVTSPRQARAANKEGRKKKEKKIS